MRVGMASSQYYNPGLVGVAKDSWTIRFAGRVVYLVASRNASQTIRVRVRRWGLDEGWTHRTGS
jgi:hypothetical protein